MLAAVDEAIAGLARSTLASAVLAEPTPPATADAGRMPVRWSNAGHPAPLLLEPGRPARSTATGYAGSWPGPTLPADRRCSPWLLGVLVAASLQAVSPGRSRVPGSGAPSGTQPAPADRYWVGVTP